MPVLPASLLHAGSEAPLACRRPSEEKLAALALPISAERGEPHPRGPGRSCTWARSAIVFGIMELHRSAVKMSQQRLKKKA